MDEIYQSVRAQAVPFSTGGRHIFVDPRYGSDGHTGNDERNNALATIDQALQLAISGYGDVIHFESSGTTTAHASSRSSANIAWNKHRTHLIGEAAETMFSQRARIAPPTTQSAAIDPLITISVDGCRIENIQVFNGINAAVAANGIQVTGQRNKFRNVHIAGIGDNQNDVANAYSLYLNGGDENTFEDCVIGLETTAKGTQSNAEIIFAGASARNVFKGCIINTFAEASTHQLVLAGSGALEGTTYFIDCLFTNKSNGGSTTMSEAIEVHATQNGVFYLHNCSKDDAITEWDANDTGRVVGNMPASSASAGGHGVAMTA